VPRDDDALGDERLQSAANTGAADAEAAHQLALRRQACTAVQLAIQDQSADMRDDELGDQTFDWPNL
jgi:hypothetical protein